MTLLKAINGNASLAERVADQLLELIINQNLARGQKIPNEFELAKQLNVGRGTVREAVKLLVSRNILEIRRGKGTYVTERPGVSSDPLGLAFYKDKIKLASDLIDIRVILEPQIAFLAARNATNEEIEEMRGLCSKIEELAHQNEDYNELDVKLHTVIAESTRNTVMPNLIPVITNGISLYNSLPRYTERLKAIQVHREIIDAISNHEPERASDAMFRHLQFNRRYLDELMANYRNNDNK